MESCCSKCGREPAIPITDTGVAHKEQNGWTVIPNGDETVIYCPKCSKKLL